MADNTLQFQWIVVLKENLDARLDFFVAGDLLWYPVEGRPEIRRAPDVLVACGRPKGHRGSYQQWREDGVAPQVVFEVLSPGNRYGELIDKFNFYQRYGVEEYYVYDPDREDLTGYLRRGDLLIEIPDMSDHTSPRLGIRMVHGTTLEVFDARGQPFETFAQIRARADEAEARAGKAEARAGKAEARAGKAEARAGKAEARAARLAERLRAMGVDPEGD